MRELTSAGRLSAWGGAAIAGAVSPDDAADEVRGGRDVGHRVLGLPDEVGAVNLAYALARLRSLGVTGLRLVLPVAGDAGGLPGPAAFNERAVARGSVVLTAGGRPLALLPESRGLWSAHAVDDDRRTPMSLDDAERALRQVMRDGADELARLDVARWEPAAADLLSARSGAARPDLPPTTDPRAHAVLAQALRLWSIVEAARAGDGAAVTAGESRDRAAVLRELDGAARRAVEAACSTAYR